MSHGNPARAYRLRLTSVLVEHDLPPGAVVALFGVDLDEAARAMRRAS